MVTQYPHIAEITIQNAASKTAGNWTKGSETTTEKKGRFEPASGNAFITAADGTRIGFDGVFYMPLPQTTIPVGTKVVVKNGSEVLCNGSVKRCSVGQLNARIWL